MEQNGSTTVDEFAASAEDTGAIEVEPDQGDQGDVEPAPELEPDTGTEQTPNREAAKYRRQLRDTEKALTAAQEAVTTAQRALVEHLAQQVGRIRPDALWASGVELPNLLDEAGNVDPSKVTEAADEAAARLGLSRRPKPDPSQGRSDSGPTQSAWEQAFAPR